MPDEKFIKSILSMENKLQPYIDALEGMSRHIQPFEDAIRAIEQNKGLQEIQKSIAGFDMQSLALQDLEWIRRTMEVSARFRLPEMPEIPALMREVQVGPVAEALASLVKETSSLQQAAESMRGSPVFLRISSVLMPSSLLRRTPSGLLSLVLSCIPGPGSCPRDASLRPNSTGSASALPFSKLARCSLALRPDHSLSCSHSPFPAVFD